MRISDWSSDVCASDLRQHHAVDRIAVEGLDKTQIGEVAVEPGRRALSCFLNRMDRKFQRDSARFANPFANAFGQHQMMAVARRQEIGRAHVELQSLMRISYAVFCLKKKNTQT